MCGIFALLNKHSNDLLTNTIIHNGFMEGIGRGPENTKELWMDNDDMMLGFHRLAINGLDNINKIVNMLSYFCLLFCPAQLPITGCGQCCGTR